MARHCQQCVIVINYVPVLPFIFQQHQGLIRVIDCPGPRVESVIHVPGIAPGQVTAASAAIQRTMTAGSQQTQLAPNV